MSKLPKITTEKTEEPFSVLLIRLNMNLVLVKINSKEGGLRKDHLIKLSSIGMKDKHFLLKLIL
jgi:hypothetical protein